MSMYVRSLFSQEIESHRAGHQVAEQILESFGQNRLATLLVYASVNHDQPLLLKSIQETVGNTVQVVGCSSQGIMTRGKVVEAGFVSGVMGLGGSITSAIHLEEEIQSNTREKGRSLGRNLRARLGKKPKVVILHYDPLCGIDVQVFLDGLHEEVGDCAVIGGGAGQQWGNIDQTFQYFGTRVLSRAAVAVALDGPFGVEIGMSHGTSPMGVTSTVTRTDKNVILEIDDLPALEVMLEMTGLTDETATPEELASWPIGLPGEVTKHNQELPTMVRGVFGFDLEKKGVLLQTAIPEGIGIMFHHRTVESMLQGTTDMANELSARLKGRRVTAVLGFECAARTAPFLGEEATLQENIVLQEQLAPDAQWLGMFAWGEIGPWGERLGFHNYTFPLLLLTEDT